jgi:hypothetical protein
MNKTIRIKFEALETIDYGLFTPIDALKFVSFCTDKLTLYEVVGNEEKKITKRRLMKLVG